MTIRKQLFWASTALMSSFFMAETASAQSTGTAAVEVEQVVVKQGKVTRTLPAGMFSASGNALVAGNASGTAAAESAQPAPATDAMNK